MIKKICFFLSLLVINLSLVAQILSDGERKEIMGELQKQIKIISAFSSEKLDMMPVYSYQVLTAEQVLSAYEQFKTDNLIYAKWFELKTIVSQNKEVVEFMLPRVGAWYYKKAIGASANGNKKEAYDYIYKAIALEPNNIMANYEMAKIKLDSSKVILSTNILTSILSKMNPNEEQKILCRNLIAYAYDKNLLRSLALINEGKYAYAVDILTELDTYCEKDIYGICNKKLVKSYLDKSRNGIYNEHLTITKKALDIGRADVASDFVQNTYDYFQRNRTSISDTANFESIVKTIVTSYIAQAKSLNIGKTNEAKLDMIRKTKELAAMIGGKFETEALKELASLQGSRTPADMQLDSIENSAPNDSYSQKYSKYVKDTISDVNKSIANIEKEFIPSSENKLPSKSLAVVATKTIDLNKQIEDKFYETRSFMTVNNYEKVLEILESANRLAKVDLEKKEVERMYYAAIREITARRMSAAEYSIFQGDVNKADSLVAKTDELITTYKMRNDTVISRIMNSYLRALDDKVCQKKQDEINVFVYNILDCIRKNDFYKADDLISRAMVIKGSYECRLDKSKVRQLKRNIEKPIEYIKMKENIMHLLEDKDTMKFILGYAQLEEYWFDNQLSELSVEHKSLRSILNSFNDDILVVKSIEQLMKYKRYYSCIEALCSLKDFGYKTSQTKDAQRKVGKMFAVEISKKEDKIEQGNKIIKRYETEKWLKPFVSEFKDITEKCLEIDKMKQIDKEIEQEMSTSKDQIIW